MKRFIIICLTTLAVAIMAEESSLQDVLKKGNDQFTAKMFNEVAKANPRKSFVLSAFSVLTPLAQIALASEGESHDELLKTIGMPNDNVTKSVFSYANSKLRSVKDVTLKTASKIYVAKNYELNPEFSALSRDSFGSEVENVDFVKNVETANKVNEWVEDQTNHRIKNLVDPSSLNGDSKALLVNAIYFKGLWKDPFSNYSTIERNFHLARDQVTKVQMMNRKGDYKYAESNELNSQILEIPYKGDESSLVVILPREVDGIDALEEKLKDPSVLDKALNDLYETEVDVYLPKFKIETTTNLKQILIQMDVKRMFSADSARIEKLLKNVGSDLYVSDAVQKAFIEVNEEGAEAAAANVFGIVATSLIINEPPTPIFNADRPFYFLIKTSDNILFNGVMYGQ